MSKIYIDIRENKLKDYFLNNDDIKNDVIIKQLDLGDIIFVKKPLINLDNIFAPENIILIIERKTIDDLRASIKDGRHREQKSRLISNYPLEKIYYLIEGNILDYQIKYGHVNLDKTLKSLYGSMINTLVRDNLKIIKTVDIEESIYILKLIYQKILKQPDIFIKKPHMISSSSHNLSKDNSSNDNYASLIKVKKKDNLTPKICQIAQLTQIQGVSNFIATIIIDNYGSLFNLCKKYLELNNEELCCKLLIDLPIKTTTGKTRKLGKVLSERIYKFLT